MPIKLDGEDHILILTLLGNCPVMNFESHGH